MKVGSTQLTKRQSEHERKSCCVSGEAARATVRMHNTAKSTADRKMRLRCDSRYLVHVVGGGVSRVPYRLGMWPLTHLRTYVPRTYVPEDAVGVGVFLREEHATDDQARHQPAHVHEVVDEGREADADLLGVKAGAGARVELGLGLRLGAGASARERVGVRVVGYRAR